MCDDYRRVRIIYLNPFIYKRFLAISLFHISSCCAHRGNKLTKLCLCGTMSSKSNSISGKRNCRIVIFSGHTKIVFSLKGHKFSEIMPQSLLLFIARFSVGLVPWRGLRVCLCGCGIFELIFLHFRAPNDNYACDDWCYRCDRAKSRLNNNSAEEITPGQRVCEVIRALEQHTRNYLFHFTLSYLVCSCVGWSVYGHFTPTQAPFRHYFDF